MGEDVSGRENADELTPRDESVTARTKKWWAFGMCWQPRKGGERKHEVEAGKYATRKLSEPGNRQPQEAWKEE